MTQEEFIKYTERMNKNIVSLLKGNEEELAFYSQLVISFNRICDEKYKMEDKINKAINFIDVKLKNVRLGLLDCNKISLCAIIKRILLSIISATVASGSICKLDSIYLII